MKISYSLESFQKKVSPIAEARESHPRMDRAISGYLRG